MDPNADFSYRYLIKKKKKVDSQDQEPLNKKLKNIETSTPVDCRLRRDTMIPSPELSPDAPIETGLPKPFILEGSDNQPSDSEVTAQKSPTGTSLELDKNEITPTKKLETSEDMDGGANALMEATTKAGICFQVQNVLDVYNHEPPPVVGSDNSNTLPVVGSDNSGPQRVEVLLEDLDLSSNPSFDNVEPGRAPINAVREGEAVLLRCQVGGGDVMKVDSNKLSTPRVVRKKLVFGTNLTPEIANARASPLSTPRKRSMEDVADTWSNSASKKRQLSKFGSGGVLASSCVTGINALATLEPPNPHKKNVAEHLMGMRGRSMSTPAERKRRVSVRKLSSTPRGGRQLKQQQISDLLKPGQEIHKKSSGGDLLATEVSKKR